MFGEFDAEKGDKKKMNDDSKIDYDFAVTKILTVVEHFPDPKWCLFNLPKGQHFVLCTAFEGEATYQLYGAEPSLMQVEAGDAMFFTEQRTRSAQANHGILLVRRLIFVPIANKAAASWKRFQFVPGIFLLRYKMHFAN